MSVYSKCSIHLLTTLTIQKGQECEVKAGGPGVEGHPQLHSRFEASLGYMTLGLKQTKDKDKATY